MATPSFLCKRKCEEPVGSGAAKRQSPAVDLSLLPSVPKVCPGRSPAPAPRASRGESLERAVAAALPAERAVAAESAVAADCAAVQVPYQEWKSIDEVNRRLFDEASDKWGSAQLALIAARKRLHKAQAEEAYLAEEAARARAPYEIAVSRMNLHNTLYDFVIDLPESEESEGASGFEESESSDDE